MAAYNELMQLNEVERSVCEYCKGNTKMDDYGQCRACGAPKPIVPPIVYYNSGVMSTAAIDYSNVQPGAVWSW